MSIPVLSLPDPQPASRPPETRPKEAQAWLASLPLADTIVSSEQLYQALFALNRMTLEAKTRLELMELYCHPVASVTRALQHQFIHETFPLPQKKRQLAIFLRQLQMEMAYGYKFVVRDLLESRTLWSRKSMLPLAIERAIHYLGEALLRSYHVYMPCPPGIWREIHALYRHAEESGLQQEPVQGSRENTSEKTTIHAGYLQAVLLGLCGPYQSPQNECLRVNDFLANWAVKATLSKDMEIDSPVGRFLIDLTADLPAMLFPRDVKLKAAPYLRVLSAIELARVVHEDINLLQKGASAHTLKLGVDCIDTACLDMLRRMIRFWGMAARRQFSRHARRQGHLSICAGVNALHFFSDGQRPFAPPEGHAEMAANPVSVAPAQGEDEVVTLDFAGYIAEPDSTAMVDASPASVQEVFRIGKWRIRDESAGGMSLVRQEHTQTHVRQGDLLGILNEDTGQWRAGVARWLKSDDSVHVELGVEMLAPSVTPAAVRLVSEGGPASARYHQALVLPALPALHQPATLLLARGLCQTGQDLYLLEADDQPRRVRVMKVLERTGSFEQILFVDVNRQ